MHQHLHYRGPRRRKEKRAEEIFEEIIAENSLTWKRREATKSRKQRVSERINPRRSTLRHIVIKLTKIKGKDKIVKAKREKCQITYKRTPIRLSADFSTETLPARRECHNIFKVMEGKNLQSRITSKTLIHGCSLHINDQGS